MRITWFEDIDGWNAPRALGQSIIEATRDRSKFTDLHLLQQIRNCVDSTMSNITEGFDSGTDREFVRFLKMAYRSMSELQSHLYFALDSHFLDQKTFDTLRRQAHETKAQIGGFMRYLKRPRSPAS